MPQVRGLIQYLSFCDHLISLSIMHSTFFHVVTYWRICFFSRLNICHCMYKPHFYPFICQWAFILLPCLTIMNSAAINMIMLISLWNPDFISVGKIPRSGFTGSHSGSIYNFLRKHHTVFCSGCTYLHSHQQCLMIPFSSHTTNTCYFLSFL